VSRIYDAMKRGAAQEASRRSFLTAGPNRSAEVDPVAEGYQRVVQAIQSRLGSTPPHVLLVASAIHGEGASTLARELAALLSRDGLARVVLLDANLRTPSQHRAFGMDRSGGLAEVITRGLALEQAVRNGGGSPFPLVTAGRPASHPTGVLCAPAFRVALDGLRATYDWVIVDGPPITVYSDASILGPLMDGVVLVIQAERTRWEVAEQAKRALEESGATLVGGVLCRRRFHIPPALYARL